MGPGKLPNVPLLEPFEIGLAEGVRELAEPPADVGSVAIRVLGKHPAYVLCVPWSPRYDLLKDEVLGRCKAYGHSFEVNCSRPIERLSLIR